VYGFGNDPRASLHQSSGSRPPVVGPETRACEVLTIIGPTVITIWLAVMGILLVRLLRGRPRESDHVDGELVVPGLQRQSPAEIATHLSATSTRSA